MKCWWLCREIDNVCGMSCSHAFKVFRFSISARFAMETRKVNKFGKSYLPGVALGQDFRCSIIDRIISDGGDQITGYIPQSFTQLA